MVHFKQKCLPYFLQAFFIKVSSKFDFEQKGARAGAKCDHHKMKVRTRVRAHWNLDVRGACVRRKKRSQPMPCQIYELYNKPYTL